MESNRNLSHFLRNATSPLASGKSREVRAIPENETVHRSYAPNQWPGCTKRESEVISESISRKHFPRLSSNRAVRNSPTRRGEKSGAPGSSNQRCAGRLSDRVSAIGFAKDWAQAFPPAGRRPRWSRNLCIIVGRSVRGRCIGCRSIQRNGNQLPTRKRGDFGILRRRDGAP